MGDIQMRLRAVTLRRLMGVNKGGTVVLMSAPYFDWPDDALIRLLLSPAAAVDSVRECDRGQCRARSVTLWSSYKIHRV